MKFVVIAALALALSGCGWFDRKIVANVTGYAEMCIDNVIYLQFPSGVVVKVDIDGKPVTCN